MCIRDRVHLSPGKSKEINFTLTEKDLSFYDDRKKMWIAEPGKFKILIGNSSRDIALEGEFELIK